MNAQIATGLLRDIVIVGLLLYLVRIASLQFRVHRNLEAVGRSKAAVLSTFNRMIVGPQEAEVRTAIATILAQAVFEAGEIGFVDAGSDHVTMIERIAAPVAQNMTRQH